MLAQKLSAEQLLEKPLVEPAIPIEDYEGYIRDRRLIDKANLAIKIAMAKKSLYYYCQLIEPQYYRPDREYLKTYCDILQAAYEYRIYSENVFVVTKREDVVWKIAPTRADVPAGAYVCRDIIVNMPPQHFKSRTLTHFVCWMLGKNPVNEHIISVSVTENIANTFSKYARNAILEKKRLPDVMVFSDVFPEVTLKDDDRSVQFWAVVGSYFSYYSAGVGGTVTSKGATTRIMDDLVSDDKDAYHEIEMANRYSWIVNTFTSRKDANTEFPLNILNMTRWSPYDPVQRILDSPDGKFYYQIIFPAFNEETGKMLCESVLSLSAYKRMEANKVTDMEMAIFQANYNQKTIDVRNCLYSNGFHTYSELPKDEKGHVLSQGRKMQVDPADKGKDFLCAICYNEYDNYAYVTDVLYTQDPQSKKVNGKETGTEIQLADLAIKNQTTHAVFEGNNGGGSLMRTVDRNCLQKGYRRCYFEERWTSGNKEATIINASSAVQKQVIMPAGWQSLFPKFYKDVMMFQRIWALNKHDDAPDCLSRLVANLDTFNRGGVYKIRV